MHLFLNQKITLRLKIKQFIEQKYNFFEPKIIRFFSHKNNFFQRKI